MTSRDALREKMKADRLNRLNKSSDDPLNEARRTRFITEDDDSVETSAVDRNQSDVEENEKRESQKLATTLTKKRKRLQQQLFQDSHNTEDEDEEDVGQTMQRAKQRVQLKLLEDAEAANMATQVTDNTADLSIAGDGTLEDTGRMTSQTMTADDEATTSRSIATPRDGTTPRKPTESMKQIQRARLLEKFKAAKDHGKDLEYTDRKTEHKLAGRRGELRATRFDDEDVAAKDAEKETTDKLESSRRLWKPVKEAVADELEQDIPTPEESYKFFMQVWEDSDEEADVKAKKTASGVEQAGAVPAEGPQPAVVAGEQQEPADEETAENAASGRKRRKQRGADDEQMLFDDEEDDFSWLPYQVAAADYVPFEEKLAQQEQVYFVPSVVEAPASQKIPANAEVRHLEEEGFYVGPKPYVTSSNLNRMENRLLKEAGRGRLVDEEAAVGDVTSDGAMKWFGEDGRLLAQPDPTKEISGRPPIMENVESALATKRISPKVIEQSATLGGEHYQLNVDVNTIAFSHHHLFSREHVLASELSSLCDEYIARLKKSSVDFLTGKIKALKVAIHHVEETIRSLKEDQARVRDERLLVSHEQRLKDYRDEIRLSRRQRDREMETDRVLSKNIIKTWKEIKNLRAANNYTNTATKLTIRKEPSNQALDQEDWDEDVADEVIELREQIEEDYQHKLQEYNEQYRLWQEQKQRKKEAKKRQTKRQKQPTQRLTVDGVEETAEDVGRDEAAINEPNLSKPVKPQRVTDNDAKQRVEAKYNEIRRLPGEPKLFFELTSGATITDVQSCPRSEQQRRSDVTKCRVFVKVLFNGKEVSKTESKPLGQDFIVRFARLFNLEIICWPESITMEIYETYGLTTNLLSTVYAAVPEHNVTSQSGQLADIEFSSELKMSHAHEAVGSGVPVTISLQPPNGMILLTSGKLMASVLWAVDSDGNTMAPPVYGSSNRFYGGMRAKDPIADIGLSGLCDMEKLTKWIEDSKLDPNDPSNADIVHLMRPVGSGDALVPSYRRPDYFRLEHVQEEFDFVNDDEISSSRRFKLIVLRDQEVAFFKNQKVPLLDKEIDESLFIDYEKKVREEERLREADDTDSHHIAVAKFMQKVREQVMARYRLATHRKTYEDVINEDVVPNISVVLPRLAELAEPARPLRPKRIERKTVTSQNLSSVDVKIIINIVRAIGIPVRYTVENATDQPVSPRRGEDTARRQQVGQESRVHPFVEAMFQQNVLSTSVAQGTNPTWHEEICVPFKAPHNDYSSSALQTINDSLFLNLFDEYITDVSKDDRDTTTVHRRMERRWLGGLKIPFTTIYTNGRIEGTFRVDRPPVLLGYKKESRVVGGDGVTDMGDKSSDDTYVTLFITIEPPLAAPEPYQEKFESMETEELMSESYKFLAEVQKKFPKRNYLATVVSLEGVAIFVSRYIKPLKPPEEILAGGQDLVARYVSLIPFVSDNVIFPGLCDIWSDSAQFLQMLQGDEEEHAVLLTNFFLHMGKKAWLVIGSAIPEGDTSYVLTQENEDFWLWKAATGQHFSIKDSYCPLQSVACVINHENVWANIQPHDKPSQVSFQFSNKSLWKPFFHQQFPNQGLGSIQPDELIYHVTSATETSRLQNKIEDELKKKISEWRPRFITRWNRLCIQSFRKLLKTLEVSHGQDHQADHVDELRDVLSNYTMCGFPLNMPYTDMKTICDAVFATGVHVYESSDVEFALAVYVHPYPNAVMSVWVYVASLSRKRS